MKTIAKHESLVDALKTKGHLKSKSVYACISGNRSTGYEILVRDSEESNARKILNKGSDA